MYKSEAGADHFLGRFKLFHMKLKVYCQKFGFKRASCLSCVIIFIFFIFIFFSWNTALKESISAQFAEVEIFINQENIEKQEPLLHICPQPPSYLNLELNQCLPHFIVIGAMKCGTTSLWEYLEKHPSILHVKDQHHFFPDEYNKEIETQIENINNKKKIEWLHPDFPKRGYTPKQKKLINMEKITFNSESKKVSKVKKTLKKLARPIIGDKEVRYFGPSTFTWSAYFAEDFIQPFLWYLDSFPFIPKSKDNLEHKENYGKITGEASPTYVHGNSIIFDRMKYFLPDVKLILLLRNPVDRFLSSQRMKTQMKEEIQKVRQQKQKGSEKKNISMDLDALILESVAGPEENPENKNKEDDKKKKGHTTRVNSELKRGRYYEKLKHVFKIFDPSQILVIQSEFFYENTVEVMAEIETFLGIEHLDKKTWEKATSKIFNLVMDGESREFRPQEGKQKAKVKINDRSRELLQRYFKEPNRKLAELLEIKFEGWDY